MNIIFLDFDGVINSEPFINKSIYFRLFKPIEMISTMPEVMIDPTLLVNVKELCEKAEASIVITSTWRYFHRKDNFIKMFEFHGWANAPIIGQTKDLRKEGLKRGDEVNEWLKHNEVSNHIIIDDVNDFHPDQPYFQTNDTCGFTSECIEQVMNRFTCGCCSISPTI